MADFTDRAEVDAPSERVLSYLSDVANLPRFFDRMTAAEPGEGDEVVTTASLPDGRQVEGRAWFRVKDDQQRIEWGSEGTNEYHGYLEVRGSGEASEVEVHLHTTRVGDDNEQVKAGLAQTLTNLKKQIESV